MATLYPINMQLAKVHAIYNKHAAAVALVEAHGLRNRFCLCSCGLMVYQRFNPERVEPLWVAAGALQDGTIHAYEHNIRAALVLNILYPQALIANGQHGYDHAEPTEAVARRLLREFNASARRIHVHIAKEAAQATRSIQQTPAL